MQNRIVFAVLLAGLVALGAPRAHAESAGGDLGLGLVLGSPTGITARYYYQGTSSIDVAVGAAVASRHGIHVHASHLWLLKVLTRQPQFDLGLFGGIGGRLLQHSRGPSDHLHLGVRGPLGITFDFASTGVPIDAFFELALILDVISGDHDENTVGLDLNAAVGARWYF